MKILSGVFEGKTTGTPIGLLIENTDQRSKDYSNIEETFVRRMLTTYTPINTVSVITVAVVARRLVRPLCGLLRGLLLSSFWHRRVFRYEATCLS